MERLTERERNFDGTGISKKNLVNKGMITDYCEKILTKLADYEDAEEDGLLIRVPHSIGTEVYFAFKLQGVKKDNIRRWQYNNKGLMFYSHGSAYSVDAIGKTVFLTKSEAEQALAKMKGE